MVRPIQSTLMTALVLILVSLPAAAQTLLRDAEMERALRELARPVIAASGLAPGQINIVVLKDSSLNAFVMNSQSIFIHSGLLLKMKTPQMLQAVIAHEVAHIANGHLTRRASNAASARNIAAFGMLLSAAVATQNAKAAAGLGIGTLSTANRIFLGHTRAEESAADQSGIRYLARSNISPQAMVDVMEIFVGQEVLSSTRQDPYVRSHPLSRERVRALKGFATGFKETDPPDPKATYWYDRVRGKLSAYLRAPSYTLRRTPSSDTSDAAYIARALAHHKNSATDKALAEINTLLRRAPKDAYALELKGQILLESRRFAPAVEAYRTASGLAPKQGLILAGYGQALLAAGQPKTALGVLEKARTLDTFNPRLLRDLSIAYAKTKNPGMASLSTAERYAMTGRMKDAGLHANRAAGLLPRGSSGWRRAMDIADAAETMKTRNKR
ncbi:MAG: putative Zn-dependent protease [Paracoccaceae bacterium]|jgi:predicted Zn-dependent protease